MVKTIKKMFLSQNVIFCINASTLMYVARPALNTTKYNEKSHYNQTGLDFGRS